MNTQKKARSLYWDIVKGWGIIAIVLGHTGYFAGAFVYLFYCRGLDQRSAKGM